MSFGQVLSLGEGENEFVLALVQISMHYDLPGMLMVLKMIMMEYCLDLYWDSLD